MEEKSYVQIFSDGAGNYPVHTGTLNRLNEIVDQAKKKGITLMREGGPVELPGPGQNVKIIASHLNRADAKAIEFRYQWGNRSSK